MEYVLHVAVLCAIFVILTSSLDLLVGQTGMLSVAHAAFFGIGAYASAILVTLYGLAFVAALLFGIIVAAAVSLIVSASTSRLRDDYFLVGTFGFQMIMFGVFNNWIALTRGPLGIAGIPSPVIFGWHCDTRLEFLGLAVLFAVTTVVVVIWLSESPFGRVLRAIREDEVLAAVSGKNTAAAKTVAFAVSAALAASAGTLYAHYVKYIDPASFTITESVLVLSMLIIGGAGSRWGPVLGATVLVVLPEVLRLVGLPSSVAGVLRQFLYGSLLIVVILNRPQGILGKDSEGLVAKRS